MEASTLQAPAALARPRIPIGIPLLRLRSDDQLVALFRAGHDEAFGAIHERYHKRLLAYARQMLPRRQDAEDALQDVFVRAYAGLRVSDDHLALRPWLFRVAHNRCVDELRRPGPPPPEVLALLRSDFQDPIAHAEQRESLRRLIADVRRLPEQQRSALLMRELGGMSYADLACALGVTVPALKSLLVRARVGLVQAAEARDTDCGVIREEIASAHDRGVRPSANARRHMRDCVACRGFRHEVRGVSKSFASVLPAAGPLAAIAHMLGFSGGAGGGATAGGAGAGGAGAAAASGSAAAGGGLAVVGTGHVATLIAAAVATAGGAVEIQHTIASPPPAPRVQSVAVGSGAAPPAAVAAASSPAPAAASGTAIIGAPPQQLSAAQTPRPPIISRHARSANPLPAPPQKAASSTPTSKGTAAATPNPTSPTNVTTLTQGSGVPDPTKAVTPASSSSSTPSSTSGSSASSSGTGSSTSSSSSGSTGSSDGSGSPSASSTGTSGTSGGGGSTASGGSSSSTDQSGTGSGTGAGSSGSSTGTGGSTSSSGSSSSSSGSSSGSSS